jgi:hypothetical protein
MTFAAGIFGISVFSGLIFLIVAAWREDRRGRSQRAREILSLSLGSTVDEDISSSIRERCRYEQISIPVRLSSAVFSAQSPSR